ncbi:MAG: BBP7 family outer membrane beta-barrel protein [Gemmataceae bacterium]
MMRTIGAWRWVPLSLALLVPTAMAQQPSAQRFAAEYMRGSSSPQGDMGRQPTSLSTAIPPALPPGAIAPASPPPGVAPAMPPVMSGAPVSGMPLMANGGMNASTYPVPPMLQPNVMPMAPAGNMFPTSPNGMGVLDSHVWFQADYLLFWINGAQLPPLLTESRAGTPLLRAGVVGAPGTTTVFGDEGVNDNLRSGVRTRIGGWLGDARHLGVEFGFFMLEGQGQGAAVGSYDADVIAGRPFISAITDRRAVEFVSFPRVLAGVATVDASSTNFYAADALIRYNLLRGTARARIHKCPEVDGCFSMDLVGGYRFLNYGDSVRIREEVFLVSQSQLDSRLLVSDDFAARNTFHGGFLGFDTEIQRGRWSLKTLIHIWCFFLQKRTNYLVVTNKCYKS